MKRVIAAIAVATSILASSALAYAEDTVVLVDGRRVRGTIVEDQPGRPLVITVADGKTRSIKRSAISSVEYEQRAADVRAQAPEPPPPLPPPPAPLALTPAAAVPPSPERQERIEAAQRARASVGRFFLESLGGAVIGSLAAYGAFKAACGDKPCVEGALAGLGANLVATPLSVWLIGNAAGGDGGLGWSFAGGLSAFAGYAGGNTDPTLPLVVGVVLMPFTSALLYEVSSHGNAVRALRGVSLTPSVTPVYGSGGFAGAMGGLSGQF